MRFVLSTIVSVVLLAAASAQSVLVMWGDSVICGFGSTATTGSFNDPLLEAPYGSQVNGGHRWDHVSGTWIPVTPYQNLQGVGADPAYGAAYAWKRLFDEDIYIISLGIPGTDVDPALHAASWHPLALDSRFLHLRDQVQAAMATLPDPHIRAIIFSTGNLFPTLDLVKHIEDVNNAIIAEDPGSAPSMLGLRSWALTAPDTSVNRTLIPQWAAGVGRRTVIDGTALPARTGGLPDGVHPTHWGYMLIGYYAVILERFS